MNLATPAASATSRAREQLIFITGASRSGTTLLSFILRKHPQVLGLPELHYFGEFCDPRRPTDQPGLRNLMRGAAAIYARHERGVRLGSLQPCEPDELRSHARARAAALLDRLAEGQRDPYSVFAAAVGELASDSGRSIVCEQTPRNIFYAEALLNAYPDARIVHMVRDPRAVMASQKRRWKRRRLLANRDALSTADALRAWVNYHPYTMAALWSRATAEAIRLRSHPRFLMIRFEDLLARPDETVRKVCHHLDLEFNRGMLEVPQVNSSHESSAAGARPGFNVEAIDAWRRSLTTAEIAVTERLCRDGMIVQGYEPTGIPALSAYLRYGTSYLAHAAGVFVLNPRRAWIQLMAMMR
ncbi:MAG: sulfotransferase [Gammaproteobacteria bacterium]|jgi:hypothetical protein|nr:sulfotransferase [Gammaproteobacteria bacterium]